MAALMRCSSLSFFAFAFCCFVFRFASLTGPSGSLSPSLSSPPTSPSTSPWPTLRPTRSSTSSTPFPRASFAP